MRIEPRSQVVEANGLRLHSLEWGDEGALPVVILHGFTGHAWQADHPAQRLAATHRVVALDQRGHGDSDCADLYGTRPMTDDLVAFLDVLGIERVDLVGHSLGGIVGLCTAALHPARVARLVLGDIGPEPAASGIARIQRNVASRDVFRTVDDAFDLQVALNPTADPAALRHRVEHNLVEQPDGTFTWKYSRTLRDGTARHDNFAPDELWACFAAVDVPVLILRGEHSDILSDEIAQRMLATNPRARLVVVPGAGHSIATDAPDAVADALLDFLD